MYNEDKTGQHALNILESSLISADSSLVNEIHSKIDVDKKQLSHTRRPGVHVTLHEEIDTGVGVLLARHPLLRLVLHFLRAPRRRLLLRRRFFQKCLFLVEGTNRDTMPRQRQMVKHEVELFSSNRKLGRGSFP